MAVASVPYLNTVPAIRNPELVPYDARSGDELLRTVHRLFRTSKAMRQPYEAMWREYWNGWDGSLQIAETGSAPTHYANHIWKLTETVVARLTEQLPEWNVLPTEMNDEELAAVFEKFLEWSIRKAKAAGPLQQGIRNAEVSGTGIWKTPWNPDANRGKGLTEIICCDPLRIYFDLSKTRLEEMTFVIQEYFLETAYIKGRWGVNVKPVQMFSDMEMHEGLVVTANRSTIFGTANLPTDGSPEGTMITGRTRVLECWLRDFVLQSTGIALPKEMREKAKHPDWFVVYAVEDQLLPEKGAADGEGPNVTRVPYRQPPFVVYCPITSEKQFYGTSPMHPLLDPQRDLNEGREQLREHRIRHANPRITIDPRYPQDLDELNNRDHPIYVPPGAMQYLNPPPLAPEVMIASEMAVSDMEDISGIHDVERGERVPQLTSGKAIDTLQRKAETRVNARLPLLSESLVDIGNFCLENGITQVGIAGLLRLAGSGEPDLTKVPLKEIQLSLDDVLTFDVQVTVGSSAAERAELQQMATLLAQAQMLDAEAVLTLFKVPGMWKILNRMEQKAQQAAAAEAAAQQPQGEAPNPYSDESIASATDVSQLPQEMQAVIGTVRKYAGDDLAERTMRGMQSERGAALSRREVGAS